MAETIRQALFRAVEELKLHFIESAHIDAQLLVCHCLQKQKAYLFSHPEHVLTTAESNYLTELIRRRGSNEPMAYIIGQKEFWSRPFLCTPSTLIPRPETELIVETALRLFSQAGMRPRRILDLGTGTGCIGISLALEWPASQVVLTDIDFNALKVARQNVSILMGGEERAIVLCSDWFQALSTGEKYDLITVNPPYISHEDASLLSADIIDYEPHRALFSHGQGLYEMERIFKHAHRYLALNGAIICEIGWDQGTKALNMVKNFQLYGSVFVKRDLSGRDRAVVATL